jgi:hypothetical protein
MPAAPGGEARLFTNGGGTYPDNDIRISVDIDRQVRFWINVNGSPYYYTYTAALATGAWHSLAFVRATLDWVYGYVNGTRVWTREIPSSGLPDVDFMYIGSSISGGNLFTGYIDEVRVTKSARYTEATYTLATGAFPNS